MIRPILFASIVLVAASAAAQEAKKKADVRITELRALGKELDALEVNTVASERHPNILTSTSAISLLWSNAWASAIGEAAYGAATTGKRPAIILLVDGGAIPGVTQCKETCKFLGIRLSTRDVASHTTTEIHAPSKEYLDALDALRKLNDRAERGK